MFEKKNENITKTERPFGCVFSHLTTKLEVFVKDYPIASMGFTDLHIFTHMNG